MHQWCDLPVIQGELPNSVELMEIALGNNRGVDDRPVVGTAGSVIEPGVVRILQGGGSDVANRVRQIQADDSRCWMVATRPL